jgi:NADH-quinone oxidoreductase subunit B
LIRAVIDLQEKVQRTGTIDAREFAARTTFEGPAPLAKELAAADLVVSPGNYKTGTRVRPLPMVN